MAKPHWAMAIMLLSAVWAVAQNSRATSQTQPQSTQQTTTASGQDNETIEGCLSGSSGRFTLTDSVTGKVYTLTGDVATLSDHAGQEVRLTGSSGEAGPRTPGAPVGAGATGATGSFNVKKARTIANTCKSNR